MNSMGTKYLVVWSFGLGSQGGEVSLHAEGWEICDHVGDSANILTRRTIQLVEEVRTPVYIDGTVRRAIYIMASKKKLPPP